jgi:glycosyltransferase involved in cell wall biosynthesis
VLWGVSADPIAFPDGWTIISPVPFSEFFDKLNSFGHDIALAPLARNVLNQSRSANKFYESAICSKPAACVASRYGAFQVEIEHGVSGMLYSNIDEFVENMSRLIEDRAFREKIADNGRKRCWARLNPDQHIRELAEAVRHWLTPGSG